ncbi:ATP/maltotriose-dependent transcriptional regulator MalT [Stackebrandtia albiflava]|uniref:ATP/maltotriose-dependent transcriptional regulator MalT n=1 Tax=Stackebrandtia albiflava TaxID=406432 RepID=A0A562V3S1_9ACTN|nr:LuxR family transcriptional regulator [Stackebrandtia albiflava]TWJ12478.1 ATP/maltotriose-dependent transcriptional regulator MalT [Stackebrandtia albiflava]
MTSIDPLVPRVGLMRRIRRILAERHRVVVCGPAGVGKSVILEQTVPPGETALRAFPSADSVPLAGLAELFATVAPERIAALPPPRRNAVEVLLRTRDGDSDPTALRLGLRDLLTGLSADRPVWLVVDAADHCDPGTVDSLSQLLRHLPPERVRAVFAGREPGLAHRFGLPADQEVTVPFWSLAETSELLARFRLPSRIVAETHRASGGLPGSALRMTTASTGNVEAAPPAYLAEEQLATLSQRTRYTLLTAASALDPTVELLQRAGRTHARRDLVAAERLGLVHVDAAGRIVFHAEATVETLRDGASTRTASRAHRALAGVVADSVAAVRHLALAGDDAVSAARLDEAASEAIGRGDPLLAAELALLAADRTPASEDAAVVARLLVAARHASAAGRLGLVERAAKSVCRRATVPAQRMEALLAMINAVGQHFDGAQWAFAAAALETETEPALRAELLMWQCWRAYIRDGDVAGALALAEQASRVCGDAGEPQQRMQILTMKGRMQRSLGDVAAAESTLSEALEASDGPGTEIAASAQFAIARHRLFDDRLTEARDDFTVLLSEARRAGEFKGRIEVLRGLAEVEARLGDCRDARAHLDEALTLLADGDLSPAPVWYLSALVDVAAGDFESAVRAAGRGLRSAREERDVLFTARGLFATGVALSRGGDPAAAVPPLREAGEIETGTGTVDPSILLWRPELVEALAGSGEVEQARRELSRVRELVARMGLSNVIPRLDVAEAACLAASGETVSAVDRLAVATEGFARYGLRIDVGRSLLAAARLERRRRRRAVARRLLAEARRAFEECGAEGWAAVVDSERDRVDAVSGDRVDGLTPGEARLAELVADGASNQQAATALGVSVKTVEATLTRIYRKLGVQARVQLAGLRGRRTRV